MITEQDEIFIYGEVPPLLKEFVVKQGNKNSDALAVCRES